MVVRGDENLYDATVRLFQALDDVAEWFNLRGMLFLFPFDYKEFLAKMLDTEVEDDGQCLVARGAGVQFCVDELKNKWYWEELQEG